MAPKAIVVLSTAVALASYVTAHGFPAGVVVDGKYFQGYNPSMQYQSEQPELIAWATPQDISNGFIASSAYTTDDIVCHLGATPGALSAPVKAGGTVDLQWTPEWPESHKGPVINYLAPCNGACSDVDKSTLQFTKIQADGLIDGSTSPGTWASDDLIANNNTGSVKIPESIAPGNYTLRHEIIALHSAGSEGGAQSYPFCVNVEVTGSGTNDLAKGTVGTALYTPTDPGIKIDIYNGLDGYEMPGPPLLSS